MPVRVAAVDCGTNSLRLLVADVDRDHRQSRDVLRTMQIVRLGEGVDRTGRLSVAALARTQQALAGYAARMDHLGVQRIRMVATSAVRDAANGAQFTEMVRATLGVAPEVLTGSAEAELSFAGATRELPAAGLAAPYLVVDIGGGSTEFVSGDARVRAAVSVDVGCVRLTERHLRGDPPHPAQIAAAVADVDAALDRVGVTVPFADAVTVVGLAGSVTTVAAMALRLPAYDPARIHLARVRTADVDRITGWLLGATRAERAAIPVLHPGRVDVIAAGALVLRRVLHRGGFSSVVASEHDILDAVAWSVA